ncbi:zinc finger and BTB domain-containing protein 24-like isoform X3 [Macrobrachium nipponense]
MGDGGGMLSLSWNNHSSTFSHMLASLRRFEHYSDVTLSCDGEFYCVHKFVLSMCSDYFTKVFEGTPCKHPVIVLKDIQKKEMEALLNYMYLGQVSVAQNDLAQLIRVAEILQIRGLAVPDDPIKGDRKGRSGQFKKKGDDKSSHDICTLESKSSSSADGSNDGKQHLEHGILGHVGDGKGSLGVDGGSGQVVGEQGQGNNDNDDENHSGLIRIGACFHSKESTGFNVGDLVDQNMEVSGRDGSEDSTRNSIYYNRDGRNPSNTDSASHPQLQELYGRESLRPQLEDSECGGNTDGSALSVSRFKYDKMYQNRAAFYHTLAQENTITEGQPGPSLFHGVGVNEAATRSMEGSVTVESMHSFTEEAFQNPYFLFSSADQNDCLSPKLRSLEKRHKRPYACTQCSYSTSSRSNLVIHMRTHTGERPYSCPECSFSASFEYNLKVHMRTHTGEKPFTCPHCPVKFAQKSHLKNHLVTHTGLGFGQMKMFKESLARRCAPVPRYSMTDLCAEVIGLSKLFVAIHKFISNRSLPSKCSDRIPYDFYREICLAILISAKKTNLLYPQCSVY